MTSLEKLLQRAVSIAPVEKPQQADWERAFTSLGRQLPADYVATVAAFGSGYFGNGMILRNPAAGSRHLCLSREALIEFGSLDSEFEVHSGELLFPAAGGLILISNIDRQLLFYRPHSELSDSHQLVYMDSDFFEVHDLTCGIAEFIETLYSGKRPEPWADELRRCIWRELGTKFFTQATIR